MLAMAAASLQFLRLPGTTVRYPCQKCNVNHQVSGLTVKAMSGRTNSTPGHDGGKKNSKKIKLSPDKKWPERKGIPFSEEHPVVMADSYLVEMTDINRLLNQADSKYQLVLDIAAEATEFQIKNKSRCLDVHPLSKVISDRMNEDGFPRPDGYVVDETYGLIPDSWVRHFEN